MINFFRQDIKSFGAKYSQFWGVESENVKDFEYKDIRAINNKPYYNIAFLSIMLFLLILTILLLMQGFLLLMLKFLLLVRNSHL